MSVDFHHAVQASFQMFRRFEQPEHRVSFLEVETMRRKIRDVLLLLPADQAAEQRHASLQAILLTLEAISRRLQIQATDAKLPNSSSSSSQDKSSIEERSDDQLDSFAKSRKAAIESTLVHDLTQLPLLSDIVGLIDAKEALLEALVDPLLYPEWFAESNAQPWRCLLLFGPPGTGKSALCGAIAREVGALFYSISSSDLISSWSGQSEKLIRSLFDAALEQHKPTVIFMDEIDSLCRMRNTSEGDANRRVKTELLVQIPRLQSVDSKAFLITATNCPWELDPAFLRRFEKKVYVGLPDEEARAQLFSRFLSKTLMKEEVTWKFLAERTEGFSGDDIRRLSTEIVFFQFRLYKEEKRRKGRAENSALSCAHVTSVISSSTPTVSVQQLQQFETFCSPKMLQA